MKKSNFCICIIVLLVSLVSGCTVQTDPKREVGRLTIMTYNIHHGADMNGRNALREMKDLMQRINPDIIAVQEVDHQWGARSNFQKQLEWLSKELGMNAAFGPTLRKGEGQYGMGILSKYPITRVENIKLSGELEQRGVLNVEVQIGKQMLSFWNTHLGLSPEDRRRQINQIVELTKGHPVPHILLGDFNVDIRSDELDQIRAHFTQAGQIGFMTTLVDESVVIDNIFLSNYFVAKKINAIEEVVSDHFPVYAEIEYLIEPVGMAVQ